MSMTNIMYNENVNYRSLYTQICDFPYYDKMNNKNSNIRRGRNKNSYVMKEKGINCQGTVYTLNVDININEEYESMFVNSIKYLKKVASDYRIDINKNKMSGMPVLKDTRIPVSLVVECLKNNLTIDDICEDYDLDKEQIVNSLDYVIDILDRPFVGDEE